MISTPYILLIIRCFTICFIVVLFSFKLSAQAPCDLRKDKDGVKVYTCALTSSKLKSIKASFSVNARAEDLILMVLDINNYDRWQYNTINPKVLKQISESELIYYTEVVAPWPISNRDMVIHLTVRRDSVTQSVLITANSIPDYVPEKEGLVRVPKSQSHWNITPGISGLRVEYAIEIDPGGSVPAWMVNMVCAEAPYTSFKNLKARLEPVKL